MGLLLSAIVLAAMYLSLQLYYLFQWRKVPAVVVPESYTPSTGITIIVVARNEGLTIEYCIQSLQRQHYPTELFEIIVINDRSTDDTSLIVTRLKNDQLQLFELAEFPGFIHPPAFKKSGIELGVHKSKHELIVVTDADCTHHPDWLRTISFVQQQTGSVFLTAPLQFSNHLKLLMKMQQMEAMTLTIVSCAGIRSGLHDIANGANMAFSKNAFVAAGGYQGNYEYASGDDMFLVEKMRANFPTGITFIKSKTAFVYTSLKTNWNSLIQQRVRWAGKNKGLKSPVINLIWVLVGIYHIAIILLFAFSLYNPILWIPFFILLVTKWISDYVVLHAAALFFDKQPLLQSFIPLQIIYLVYVIRLGWNILLRRKSDWS